MERETGVRGGVHFPDPLLPGLREAVVSRFLTESLAPAWWPFLVALDLIGSLARYQLPSIVALQCIGIPHSFPQPCPQL